MPAISFPVSPQINQVFTVGKKSYIYTGYSWDNYSNLPTEVGSIIQTPQVQTDWTALSGLGSILNKPSTLEGFGITDAMPLTAGIFMDDFILSSGIDGGNPWSFMVGDLDGGDPSFNSGTYLDSLEFTDTSDI